MNSVEKHHMSRNELKITNNYDSKVKLFYEIVFKNK